MVLLTGNYTFEAGQAFTFQEFESSDENKCKTCAILFTHLLGSKVGPVISFRHDSASIMACCEPFKSNNVRSPPILIFNGLWLNVPSGCSN